MTAQDMRELDAWIAVHLFNWEWFQRPNVEFGKEVMRKALFPPDNKEWIRWNFDLWSWEKASEETAKFSDWDRAGSQRDDDFKLGAKRITGLPHYTTDPAAAMEVLKRCAGKLWEDTDGDRTVSTHPDDPYWVCMETDVADGIRTEAPTLELSICLFAQKLFTK